MKFQSNFLQYYIVSHNQSLFHYIQFVIVKIKKSQYQKDFNILKTSESQKF